MGNPSCTLLHWQDKTHSELDSAGDKRLTVFTLDLRCASGMCRSPCIGDEKLHCLRSMYKQPCTTNEYFCARSERKQFTSVFPDVGIETRSVPTLAGGEAAILRLFCVWRQSTAVRRQDRCYEEWRDQLVG